jgi:hypothetical protein
MKTKIMGIVILTIFASASFVGAADQESLKRVASLTKTTAVASVSVAKKTNAVAAKMDAVAKTTVELAATRSKAPVVTTIYPAQVASRWINPAYHSNRPDFDAYLHELVDRVPCGWDKTFFDTIFAADGQSAYDIFRWNPVDLSSRRLGVHAGLQLDSYYVTYNTGHGWQDWRGYVFLEIGIPNRRSR